jgi:2-polyprenyl-3-methyl-5-hydroxy-6-metoxy-1,4-benzoquinol methylase
MPRLITGNVYDKYNTSNLVFRFLVNRFIQFLADHMPDVAALNILEIGCGEGYLARELFKRKNIHSYTGIDVDSQIINLAWRNCAQGTFEVGSAYELGRYHGIRYDCIIAAEVLEHLNEPARALAQIRRLLAHIFIFTAPNEPLWRRLNMLRLRYLTHWGNTPGHVQHWNAASFEALLSCHFTIQELDTLLPWIVAVCS